MSIKREKIWDEPCLSEEDKKGDKNKPFFDKFRGQAKRENESEQRKRYFSFWLDYKSRDLSKNQIN